GRSLIFVVQMYAMMALMGLAFFPLALVSARGAVWACKTYCVWVRWTARWMVGIRSEVRGPIPDGNILVASKHQSFFDIILIYSALPSARFIMKRELMWAPVIGQYALRLGCIPVDRGKRGEAIRKMVADVAAGATRPGQLVIYPQGTRVAPGATVSYKVGSAVLYSQFGHACAPAATNVGLFWPRKGLRRTPGLAVVEFLPVIEPGLDNATFMARLETEVEAASDRLMAEGGFHA
ncbi:MAG: lysophospholipid acyltransferase family protein, partial [Paracoccaceae bacterium]